MGGGSSPRADGSSPSTISGNRPIPRRDGRSSGGSVTGNPGSLFSGMFDLLRSFFRKWLARKAPLELSYSKISAYRFCPWKYKLLYHDGRRVPPNPHISLGQSVHKALEEFHKREGKTLDELLEAYDKVWG